MKKILLMILSVVLIVCTAGCQKEIKEVVINTGEINKCTFLSEKDATDIYDMLKKEDKKNTTEDGSVIYRYQVESKNYPDLKNTCNIYIDAVEKDGKLKSIVLEGMGYYPDYENSSRHVSTNMYFTLYGDIDLSSFGIVKNYRNNGNMIFATYGRNYNTECEILLSDIKNCEIIKDSFIIVNNNGKEYDEGVVLNATKIYLSTTTKNAAALFNVTMKEHNIKIEILKG